MPKVSVIGAGNVGGLCAARIAESGLANVVLLDIDKDLCKGKVYDIQDSLSFLGFGEAIKPAEDYKDIRDSDIVVVTAGLARRPGMTRDDLLEKNGAIIKEIIIEIKKNSPDSIIIMVTNPVDVLTYIALKIGKFSENKVLGMGPSLDNARFKSLAIADLKVTSSSVDSAVYGQHGDSMAIFPRLINIGNKPLVNILNKDKLGALVDRTKNRGKEIVSLYKAGSAYFAPSAAVNEIVRVILMNENKLIPVSVFVDGLLGLKDLCIGLPAIISSSGIKEIASLNLNKNELEELHHSAEEIKSNIEKIRKII